MPDKKQANVKDIKKLGIIAGAGQLPIHVAEACKKKKLPFTIVLIDGSADIDEYKGLKNDLFQTHKVSKVLSHLKKEGVTHVTMAGKVQRGEISKLLTDLKGAALFAMIVKNGMADNAILKTVIEFMEKNGFGVIAPEKIANELVLPKGKLGKVKPNKHALADIKTGLKTLEGVAGLDVGQALVIQNGLVLGVEAAEGTDELIKRCGEIKQEGEPPILIKMIKPHQDQRIDMPCIGAQTIENAAKFGIAGIAAEAGSTLVLDVNKAISLADKNNIFIYGF